MPMPPLSPTLALLSLLALLYAGLFHLWRGRRWSDLALALLMAGLGLAFGQLGGPLLGIEYGRVGETYVLPGTLFAWGLMLAAAWLKG
ncbi:MAG: hypothetical protein RMN24_04030 [Anaerolineae bacterium]|nr:hypothetical protein [Caldilineales bacterium]MDW8268315.1 hypothetical protein [Anaerolineae bacterium]